jgi:hypothetical protein
MCNSFMVDPAITVNRFQVHEPDPQVSHGTPLWCSCKCRLRNTHMHDMMIVVPLLPEMLKILNLRGLPGTTG